MRDTRDRLLDAAEHLFAEEGFSASLRAITSHAGTNLAAVNYHFGSKQGLVQELLRDRSQDINDERMAELAKLRDANDEKALPVEDIIRAFLAPVMQRRQALEESKRRTLCIMQRLMIESQEMYLETVKAVFDPIVQAFHREFQRSLPALSQDELWSRFLFMVGAMSFTMTEGVALKTYGHFEETNDDPDSEDEVIMNFLITFVKGGMLAPGFDSGKVREGDDG